MTEAPPPASPPPAAPAPRTGRRLFVGARISVATVNALAAAAQTLARRAREAGVDVKWVPPVNYHVTLKFLGWTRDEAIHAIRDRVVEAAAAGTTARIAFRTTRLGAFPSTDKASVVWAGVEDASGALVDLATRIDLAMEGLGIAREPRPFHPHVTLGRLRETRAVKDVVLPLAEQMFGDTRIEAVSLFESETKSSGSVYKEISRIELKTAEIRPSGTAERQTRPVQLHASDDSDVGTDDGWPRGQGPNQTN